MGKKDFNIIGKKDSGQKKEKKDSVENFISGEDFQATVTLQLPRNLKYALKKEALEQRITIKELLTKILNKYFK
jgi:hypothetical protein